MATKTRAQSSADGLDQTTCNKHSSAAAGWSYEPNWSDPRIQRRAATALAWCNTFLHPTKESPVHTQQLIEVFGQAQNPLSKYLRENLLRHGLSGTAYEAGKVSMRYVLNQKGYNRIRDIVSKHVDEKVLEKTSPINKQLQAEVAALEFKYREKSDRYWHPLQNMRREAKTKFWLEHGLPFDYDIETCAPTILSNLADQHGLHDLVSVPIREYLQNKSKLREHIAGLVGISLNDSKRLINSLFNGARLAATPFCAAFNVVGQSKEKMELLQQDREVRRLRTAVKLMWGQLQRKMRKDLSNGKLKWGLYFHHERMVLDVIKDYLGRTGNRHFTEHDGFRTERAVDLVELSMLIHARTGLRLTVKAAA